MKLLSTFLRGPRAQVAVHYASWALLLGVSSAYLGVWLHGNWGMLVDPGLQTDDARTTLFPFHRYGSAGTLADDPIAREMLALVPPVVRLLYRVLVPIVDIFVAAKIVQAFALAILVWAAVVLGRARRAGWAAAALLVFFVLHDGFAIGRVAGGLPRAFAFPCFALWTAGVVASNRRARFAAPILAALTYPSAMNLLLAAEGLYSLRGLGALASGVVLRRLKRYGILVALCVLAALPAVVGDDDRGPIHTLEQAEQEPAFGKAGRLWLLPFEKPTEALGHAFVDPLKPRGGSPIPRLKAWADRDPEMVATLLVALVLVVPLLRWGAVPWAAAAFGAGSVTLYFLARTFAFRLYSPERYYSFGMRATLLVLLVATFAQVWFWLRPRQRSSARNATAALLIFGVWSVSGNGVIRGNGMELDVHRDQKMYEFIRTLPPDVRFASHILDGDGIPLFGARANMGGFETLQPWFVNSWARQKKRAFETLDALYATDADEVLSYAKRNHVTHFLINKNRYGAGLGKASGSFQPFSDYARAILRGRENRDLVFSRVPDEAVLFTEGRFKIVSVALLERVWEH